MNIESLLDTIKEVSVKLFPETPEVEKLCEIIIKWERDNSSLAIPRYKEPMAFFLKEVEKRWSKRIHEHK